MVLAFAGMIIAGPKLFAQNPTASATNKTMTMPAAGANANSSGMANHGAARRRRQCEAGSATATPPAMAGTQMATPAMPSAAIRLRRQRSRRRRSPPPQRPPRHPGVANMAGKRFSLPFSNEAWFPAAYRAYRRRPRPDCRVALAAEDAEGETRATSACRASPPRCRKARWPTCRGR